MMEIIQKILSLDDWWDDDRKAQVNYAQYVEEPINMDIGGRCNQFHLFGPAKWKCILYIRRWR